jgi:hypothetical protein
MRVAAAVEDWIKLRVVAKGAQRGRATAKPQICSKPVTLTLPPTRDTTSLRPTQQPPRCGKSASPANLRLDGPSCVRAGGVEGERIVFVVRFFFFFIKK